MDNISRSEAKRLGLKRYYTGVECRNGHLAERLVSNFTCVECAEEARLRRIEKVDAVRYTSKPCKYGHISERSTVNGGCLECCRIKANKRRAADPEPARERDRIYRNAHIEQKRKDYRKWRSANRDKAVAATRAWYGKNHDAVMAYARGYSSKQYALNVEYKLRVTLRNRQQRVIKGKRMGSFVRDLDCTIGELREHIEAQFVNGMTWDNWGTEWQLDHIRPLVSYDLTDRAQFLAACHYTNLRPLGINEHKEKSRTEKKVRAIIKGVIV